jgi:hypothetical protein
MAMRFGRERNDKMKLFVTNFFSLPYLPLFTSQLFSSWGSAADYGAKQTSSSGQRRSLNVYFLFITSTEQTQSLMASA